MKENKYFYHLVTNKLMEVGQYIDFSGETTNTLYKFFFEKEFKNSRNHDVNRIISDNTTVNGTVLNTEDSGVVNAYLDTVSRSIRETITEMIRLKYFPEYPSRLSCLYAARDFDEVLRWMDVFESYHRKVLQIVKIDTDGTYFVGDGDLLPTNDATSFEKKIAQAMKYWSGFHEGVLPEVLLNGKIRVIEIVKDFM